MKCPFLGMAGFGSDATHPAAKSLIRAQLETRKALALTRARQRALPHHQSIDEARLLARLLNLPCCLRGKKLVWKVSLVGTTRSACEITFYFLFSCALLLSSPQSVGPALRRWSMKKEIHGDLKPAYALESFLIGVRAVGGQSETEENAPRFGFVQADARTVPPLSFVQPNLQDKTKKCELLSTYHEVVGEFSRL